LKLDRKVKTALNETRLPSEHQPLVLVRRGGADSRRTFDERWKRRSTMIHHVSLGSNDIAKARAFYDPLMSLIGFRLLKASATAAHYGVSDIVFSLETPVDGNTASPGNGVHIAFQAPDRETVRRFHAMALSNGGKDEGVPGIRANYNANYYGAFVRDPDGNKIEAVTYTARESFGALPPKHE
jgi:catechol 2,3-dioxygenase-like lactoylglutathione lyase family enzyme